MRPSSQTSERPSAARASLGGSLNAFDGSQDGGTMDGVNPASLGLRFTVDEDQLRGLICGTVKVDARYLYGTGELGGGHFRFIRHSRIARYASSTCRMMIASSVGWNCTVAAYRCLCATSIAVFATARSFSSLFTLICVSIGRLGMCKFFHVDSVRRANRRSRNMLIDRRGIEPCGAQFCRTDASPLRGFRLLCRSVRSLFGPLDEFKGSVGGNDVRHCGVFGYGDHIKKPGGILDAAQKAEGFVSRVHLVSPLCCLHREYRLTC